MCLEVGKALNSVGKLETGHVAITLMNTVRRHTHHHRLQEINDGLSTHLREKTLKSIKVPTLLKQLKDFTRGGMVNTTLVGTKTNIVKCIGNIVK